MVLAAVSSGAVEISMGFRIVAALLLIIGVYLVVVESAKNKSIGEGTTVTRKVTKKNNITDRIKDAMGETNKKLAARKDFYQSLGQDIPMGLQLQQSVVDTAMGKSGTINILILVISCIIAIAEVVVTYRFLNILSIVLALSTLAVAFIVVSAVTISSDHKRRKQALSVLTVLHSQYQNTSNFLTAVTLARDVFEQGTYEYNVLNSYYDRVHNLNMTLPAALSLLIKDLDNNVNIKQYMELVEQTETIDSSYKNALEGIPANLKATLNNREVFIKNTSLTAGFMAVSWLILTYNAVIGILINPEDLKLLSDPNYYQFFGTGILGFASLAVVLALSNRVKPKENWGAGK